MNCFQLHSFLKQLFKSMVLKTIYMPTIPKFISLALTSPLNSRLMYTLPLYISSGRSERHFNLTGSKQSPPFRSTCHLSLFALSRCCHHPLGCSDKNLGIILGSFLSLILDIDNTSKLGQLYLQNSL